MSATATPKTVQPKTTYNYILDEDRITSFNLRLNNFGRMIISRHHTDNPQLLLTQAGFNWLRKMHAVDVIKNGKVSRTKIDRVLSEKLVREKFYSLVDLSKYSDFVAKMYSKPDNISFRSVFSAKDYFMMLNKYGHNRAFKMESEVVTRMFGVLDKYLGPWMNDSRFDFDLKTFLETGKWLTHIKTNSNSGYPDNVKQDKEMMTRYASAALKVFNDYVSGKPIVWEKLAFELGYRTERKGKHRVICMAPTIEKILSSVISTFLDQTFSTLPFNLPRKFGGPQQQLDEMLRYDGAFVTKDFEAFDTSVPIHIFEILRDWFGKYDNTIAKLLRFECDLIIHSVIIIGAQLVFHICSLPSGIGVTQFIGSIIHWLLDLVFGLVYTFVMYQSDDNMGRTKLSDKEVQEVLTAIHAGTGMDIAPIGEKTFYNATQGRFLQKVFDTEERIFYNHEQRNFTNGMFRERQISDDTVFNILFDSNAKDIGHKKMVLAYLGNIVAYGQNAPSIDSILAFLYGRGSGFTKSQIEWGLLNLQKYMEQYLVTEEHRPLESIGWTEGFFKRALTEYKWGAITPQMVHNIIGSMS